MSLIPGFTGMYYADSRATRYGWAPAWYNGYRFVLTFIVCTSIVFNLIIKEYLQDSGSTHGKLDNLKAKRENVKGIEFGDKVEESAKQKYLPPFFHYRRMTGLMVEKIC